MWFWVSQLTKNWQGWLNVAIPAVTFEKGVVVMRVVIKDHRKWKIVAVVALLCGAYLAYRHYVSSPYFIKERAILLDGDCETLCRLTDEEERNIYTTTPPPSSVTFAGFTRS